MDTTTMRANAATRKIPFFINTHAFALIELLLALALLTTLLLLTVPSARDLLVENRTVTRVNTMVGALYNARTLAIQTNSKVTFCKSSDGKKCGGNWRDGQLVMNIIGKPLVVLGPLPHGDDLIWNGSAGQDNQIDWLPTGFTNGQRGTFYYCAREAEFSRAIVLLNTGRVYVKLLSPTDYAGYCNHLNVGEGISPLSLHRFH